MSVVGAATLVQTAANAAPLNSVTFMFTAAEQSYQVPAGITSVRVKAIGAPGGDKAFDGAGGYGAKLVADLAVHPGQTLYVEVGGAGDGSSFATSGWNGGGAPTDTDNLAAFGGGASDVQLKPRASATALRSRAVVAGGGGGAGSVPTSTFAIVGGNAGEDGEPPEGRHCAGNFEGGCGGHAATRTAGGAPGGTDTHLGDNTAATAGTTGAGGAGGNGGNAHGGSGGGGGGGWYGGGGGGGSELHDVAGGGGGGGSSGVGDGATRVSLTVATSSTPSITITPLIRLTVKRSGRGAGTVTGNGISCGRTCTAGFPSGTHVTLTAHAGHGSRFAGWSGGCSGRQRCSLTMSSARAVTARFTASSA
ncbi:MAG TPA: glycine-rich protein [Jatrophihabitantaceae bacterium]|nr:glycine-rich protein [Jatrophihabitantaceae bacterium]